AGRESETRAALARGVLIGVAIGVALVVLQRPLAGLTFPLLGAGSEASEATLAAARLYFDIRIWGAPFALGTYALLGWLSARGRTDYLMVTSLFITVLNGAFDWHFVLNLGLGAKGVAFGTLIAECAGFVVAAIFAARIMATHGGLSAAWKLRELVEPSMIRRTLSVNRDIFLRTLILAFAYAFFVQRGGAFGDVTLAANQTLMQLFFFTGLALDGTAIAAETMVGRAVGAEDKARGLIDYRRAVFATFIVAMGSAAAFSLFYAAGGGVLLSVLSPDGPIKAEAARYLPWVVASPLVVAAGFQLDGIFIGATRAREMRDAMVITALIFFPTTIILARFFGNHGLWAAFTLYFIMRGVTLALFMPRIARSFSNP
ncbi:MAG: MATE family efflux transporter, partial [Pseudomonadota bacterium]